MKKWLKITLVAIGLLILIPVIALLIIHEPLPRGVASPEADRLAEKMLQAVDKPAWDTTTWVRWTFAGRNSYIWDRKRHLVEISWGGGNKALLSPDQNKGQAFVDGLPVEGDKEEQLVKTAMWLFFNDSFWLLAPTKAFDPGTERQLVDLKEEHSKGLLVTYTSGGATPGDSYLWILDENGLPSAFKMWVNIIPVGGLKASWENWQTLPSGAKYAASHLLLGGYDVQITNVKSGSTWEQLDLDEDPFAEFSL